MRYTKEALEGMRAKVRQERISVQHGSPSDAEIGQAQLVDMAGDHIPGLVDEVLRLRGDLEHYNKVLEHDAAFCPRWTHAQVADKVRMLTRSDLDHELVVIMARDRIIVLASQLAAAETAAAELLARATRAEQKAQGLLVELGEQEVQSLAMIHALGLACAKPLLSDAEITGIVENERMAGRWSVFRYGVEHGANQLARQVLGTAPPSEPPQVAPVAPVAGLREPEPPGICDCAVVGLTGSDPDGFTRCAFCGLLVE